MRWNLMKGLARWGLLAAFLSLAAMEAEGSSERVRGRVVSVDAKEETIELRLERSGEVRRYAVGWGEAAYLGAGDWVRGEGSRFGGGFRLERVWPDDPSVRMVVEHAARRLRQDTQGRGKYPFRGVGETLPNFALYRQDGTVWQSRSTLGKHVVINFIFTRCLVPSMCPAATLRMARLQKLVQEAGISDRVALVSISLDPEYDTPGILAAYARDHGIDGKNFHFLTGPSGLVEDLKQQLGILAEPDERQIIRHTLMTVLVDPRGRIIYQVPGSGWSEADFLRRMLDGEGT